MEIPVINRISHFESDINSLQRQSLLSLSAMERIPRAYSFWKWGALILAILASFSALIRRIKFLIVKFQTVTTSLQEPLLREVEDEDEDDDRSSVSSSSSDHLSEDEEEEVEDSSEVVGGYSRTHEVFQVKGTAGFDFPENSWRSRSSSGLRRRRSIGDHFSEFASGKSVVKLWDNLGFGIGLELEGDDLSPSSSLSPGLFVTKASAAALGFWDARAASGRPAILAEWGPQIGSADAVGRGGVWKVHLRGRGGGEGEGKLAEVGDLRRVKTPLDNVTEADVETWWDANAVVVNDELFGGGSVWNGRGSAVTRCCDAVRSYLSF